MNTQKRPSFKEAKASYTQRYILEGVPQWTRNPTPNGRFYAPHFSTDKEWYENTLFHGESLAADRDHCYTSGQTWPLGKWLEKPLLKEDS